MSRVWKVTAVAAILPLLFLSSFGRIEAQSGDANWAYPAYDANNTNFNPQNAINKDNVGQLQLSWIYQVPVNPFHIIGAAPALDDFQRRPARTVKKIVEE